MPALQQPLGSGFGISSTAADVIPGINLAGKLAVVTGGYSGLGQETARVLLGAGARVILFAVELDRRGQRENAGAFSPFAVFDCP